MCPLVQYLIYHCRMESGDGEVQNLGVGLKAGRYFIIKILIYVIFLMYFTILKLICVIFIIYTTILLVIYFFINCTILHPIDVVIFITMTLSTRKTWS